MFIPNIKGSNQWAHQRGKNKGAQFSCSKVRNLKAQTELRAPISIIQSQPDVLFFCHSRVNCPIYKKTLSLSSSLLSFSCHLSVDGGCCLQSDSSHRTVSPFSQSRIAPFLIATARIVISLRWIISFLSKHHMHLYSQQTCILQI